uniref:CSON011062 protein n=1 Tax=Culicoides sonorensis TaxID=179676 RepID=A0A336KIK9_CULSO
MDDRIEWLRNRLSSLLGVPEREYTEPVIIQYHDQIKNFLDDPLDGIQDLDRRIFFIHRTFYDRMVEKEIIVMELAPTPATPPPEIDGVKDKRGKKGKVFNSLLLYALAGKKTKEKKPKGKRREAEVEHEIQMDNEPKMIPVIKKIPAFIKTPVLHISFGCRKPDEFEPDTNYFYMIRRFDMPIDTYDCAEDCFAEMSNRILFGTIRGSLIYNVKQFLEKIYKPMIDFQYRVPRIDNASSANDEMEIKKIEQDEENKKNTGKSEVCLMDFSRPSDFRLIAVKAKKTGFHATGDDSHLGSRIRRPSMSLTPSGESIKTDLAEIVSQVSRIGTTTSTYSMRETMSEKWEKLLKLVTEKAETDRNKMMDVEVKKSAIKESFLNNLDKFISCVDWTIDHVVCAFTLPTQYNAPGQEYIKDDEEKVKIKLDPKKVQIDELTQLQMEEIVMGWVKYLNKVLQANTDKEPDEFTPLAEYTRWTDWEQESSNLLEQIHSSFVKTMIDKIKDSIMGQSLIDELQIIQEKLSEQYKLAKENGEYLSTLQEYLLKIRDDDDFDFIISIIPNMMVGLRHIWTMSNYYCRDENMLSLLAKISNVFNTKIKGIANLETIFKSNSKTVLKTADYCAELLDCWKQSYINTRAQIENSGVGSRWEFDKGKIFGELDHIARICRDIAKIASTFILFETVFNNNLRSIVTHPEEVDSMLKNLNYFFSTSKIYQLISNIVTVDYDVFRRGNVDNWEATLDYFYKSMELMELDAKRVLDQCIQHFRSADQGIEFLGFISKFANKNKLAQYLSTKHESIMKQFVSEVGTVEHEFMKSKNNPPLLRNQPPHIGSILWERFLYEHLKKSVIAFRRIETSGTDPALEKSYLKRTAFSQYFSLVQDMRDYEKEHFDKFSTKATFIINSVMKRNILQLEFLQKVDKEVAISDATPTPSSLSTKQSKGVRNHSGLGSALQMKKVGKLDRLIKVVGWMSSKKEDQNQHLAFAEKYLKAHKSVSSVKLTESNVDFTMQQAKLMVKAMRQENVPTWKEVIGDNVLIEYKLQFAVNFSYAIFDVITEGQQFEYMGFVVNPIIRLAIMRKTLLFSDVEAVSDMIDKYNGIVMGLSVAEVHFLREHLYKVESIIQAGLGRYTWQALNIRNFAKKCQALLKQLTSMVVQINNISRDIKNRIERLRKSSLFVFNQDEILLPLFGGQVEKRKSILKPPQRVIELESPLEIDEHNKIHHKKVRIRDQVKSCIDHFKTIERRRTGKMAQIQKFYESIGPLLIKLESLVLGTNTGLSDKMKFYYKFWEKEAFNCIVR